MKFNNRLQKARGRLLKDTSGNVLMIAAAALFPLLGIIGSGVDIGRTYMAELRLQQACDAGALAGRRAMAASTGFDDAAREASVKMFNFNFPEGLFGTQHASFLPTSPAGTDVTATATVTVPTVMMHIFGFDQLQASVSCGAKLEVSNTDVMLVLDVTGSMQTGGTSSRISGLQAAARDFVNTLSSADVGDGTIRIGMVPYSNTVNVGHLLKPEWITTTVTVPSQTYYASGKSGTYWTCVQGTTGCKATTVNGARYVQQNISYDVKNIKVGDTVANKAGTTGGTAANSKWDGCIVERATVAFSATSNVPAGAYDMDIDFIPNSDATRWKPYLPGLAVERTDYKDTINTTRAKTILELAIERQAKVEDNSSWSSDADLNMGRCPAPAVKLTDMATGKQKLLADIGTLKPRGMTYHDVGLIWGGRLISPTGLFASENAVGEDGRNISRHIIFMTDGALQIDATNYSHQGLENVERRVSGTMNTSGLKGMHENRFAKICGDIKARGITIWTVNFASTPTTAENNCSSSGTTYRAANNAELGNVFRSIAGQISRLRVSQ